MPASYKIQVAEMRKKFIRRLVFNTVMVIIFIIAVGIGLTAIGMFEVFKFLLFGLMPTIFACILNVQSGRSLMKIVLAMNFAGILPGLISIILSGSPAQTALAIMKSYDHLILSYGFSIFGLCLAIFLPFTIQMYLEVRSKYIIKQMQNMQEDLVEEWGEKVIG